jgi:hypothetical protein
LLARSRDGNGSVAVHAVFAAAVKQSHLLGDFLELVVGKQHLTCLSSRLCLLSPVQ